MYFHLRHVVWRLICWFSFWDPVSFGTKNIGISVRMLLPFLHSAAKDLSKEKALCTCDTTWLCSLQFQFLFFLHLSGVVKDLFQWVLLKSTDLVTEKKHPTNEQFALTLLGSVHVLCCLTHILMPSSWCTQSNKRQYLPIRVFEKRYCVYLVNQMSYVQIFGQF